MVNLIDVVISSSDGEDQRELGSAGLRSEAAASALSGLPGEGLALLWSLGPTSESEHWPSLFLIPLWTR